MGLSIRGGHRQAGAATGHPGAYQNPRLSPDGTRIALVIPEGANSDVWIYDPQRDAITRLTFGGLNRRPAWSPDGQYVVFGKSGPGGGGIFQARADGASPPQALTGRTLQTPWSFTPDGKRLAYFEGAGNDQIWTVPLEDQGGQLKAGTPEPFLKSAFRDSAPAFSPDGKRVAVVIPEGATQAPQPEHVIVMLQNFADELRRRLPLGKQIRRPVASQGDGDGPVTRTRSMV